MFDLPLIWAFLIASFVIIYVILDGFDLGIGILYPFIQSHSDRDIMMNSVAPFWDGNETWLVLGGASLYAAFPIAYSILLSTLYMPIMIMLAALIFRGVAFEFRFKSKKSRLLWDMSFSLGSLTAAFMQGLILGTFILGYSNSSAENSPFIWITPFSIMTGIAVICGYAMLGATWLINKTHSHIQEVMFKVAKIILPLIAGFVMIVSLWTPFTAPRLISIWFKYPDALYLAPLPIATFLLLGINWLSLIYRYEKLPFMLTIAVFILCYIGFGISSWPYIVPHTITIWQAAANDKSLRFILVGALILLPVLISYSIYSYYIFRGKVDTETGYHS